MSLVGIQIQALRYNNKHGQDPTIFESGRQGELIRRKNYELAVTEISVGFYFSGFAS